MIFVAESPVAPEVEAAESYAQTIPSQLVAHVEPKWLERQQYEYKRTVLPIEGGRVLLRLTQTPLVEVDPSSRECEVVGWGIKMPCDTVEKLPKEMAHRFLDLFSKADAGRLAKEEQSLWLEILDRVDFVAFCVDRAAPHYLEGTLVRVEPICLVEWHDGECQKIDRDVARAFSALRAGDQFGAYIKLGIGNKVRSIERIVLLDTAGE